MNAPTTTSKAAFTNASSPRIQDAPQPAWHNLTTDEVLRGLASDTSGLTVPEAARRLKAIGLNQLKESQKVSPFQIFLAQFQSLLIWILLAAGVVAGLMGEVVDSIAILTIVVFNAVIGFYQEFKAEKSIVALQKMTAPQAKVQRSGEVFCLPATQVVAGDMLLLEAGDLVAADARLIKASALKCIESVLTGESESVSKRALICAIDAPLGDRENMAFMGTSVVAGTGQAVVVATGMKTELGRIAGLLEDAKEESTPLEQNLTSFGQTLVWLALGIVALLFALGLWRGTPPLEMFLTSVSLAVAAVPEGLPAVVTISLALSVAHMSRRHALIRKLPAVETLGATTVICTDKTGTLTLGEMTVRTLYVGGQHFDVRGDGYGPCGEVSFEGHKPGASQTVLLLELGQLLLGCNNAHLIHEEGVWRVIGDPTEGALLAVGAKVGADREVIEREFPRQHEIPFDSERKCSTVIRRMPNGSWRAFINGAPDVLLERSTHIRSLDGSHLLTESDRQNIDRENIEMAQHALRVLGSAYRDLDNIRDRDSLCDLNSEEVERDLVFVGLTGMVDPPRVEARDAVAKCHCAGVRVVMITGDHPRTAIAIARELGIAKAQSSVLTGVELDALSDSELRKRVLDTEVYARVSAQHKLRIIDALKAGGQVVAMTGDGVNDAPAVKGADVGVAMGKSGTEVTKQASDMIITDDNFASIVAAVEEGRGAFDNIRKTLQYLLAGNMAELLLMTACAVAGLPVPLLPIHLLWINLVTDGPPAICLAAEPVEPDVMDRSPRSRTQSITNRSFLITVFLTGVLTAGVALFVYLHGLKTQSLEAARTSAFTTLVFAELLRAFGARSESKPFWRLDLLSNKSLVIVLILSLSFQVASHHNEILRRFLKTTYMPVGDTFLLFAFATLPLLAIEFVKLMRLSFTKRSSLKPLNFHFRSGASGLYR